MNVIEKADQVVQLASRGRTMTASPPQFDGTLEELYERYIAPNLLSTAAVAEFHRVLIDYAFSHDPLLLVRHERDTERRQVYTTRDGTRFIATDNCPRAGTSSRS